MSVAGLVLAGCLSGPNWLGLEWRGDLILCQHPIDFARDGITVLPVLNGLDQGGYCGRTIDYIQLHRQYGDRTGFFGSAAMTTAGLALLSASAERQRYSAGTWDFLTKLSRDLAPHAHETARRLPANIEKSELTRQLFETEQRHVQQALDGFRRKSPDAYDTLVREVGKTLNPAEPLLQIALSSQPFFAVYLAALAEVHADLGEPVDFAKADHRVRVGLALAKVLPQP